MPAERPECPRPLYRLDPRPVPGPVEWPPARRSHSARRTIQDADAPPRKVSAATLPRMSRGITN